MHFCRTEEMIADFFTKPLQGALFLKYRDIIMNRKNKDMSNINHMLPRRTTEGSQECVRDKGRTKQEEFDATSLPIVKIQGGCI
jgi:hypothetical protein